MSTAARGRLAHRNPQPIRRSPIASTSETLMLVGRSRSTPRTPLQPAQESSDGGMQPGSERGRTDQQRRHTRRTVAVLHEARVDAHHVASVAIGDDHVEHVADDVHHPLRGSRAG
jgi:hypothetical protein